MAELLTKISWILFALAVISLLSAVVFWVKFKIPKVIGDLTGRTAKKTIAKMRSDNEKTGKMALRPEITGSRNGGRHPPVPHQSPHGLSGPAAVHSGRHSPVTQQAEAGQTGLLADNRADGLSNGEEGTTILKETHNFLEMGQGTTTLLGETEQPAAAAADRASISFEMLDDEINIHTDEVIPGSLKCKETDSFIFLLSASC